MHSAGLRGRGILAPFGCRGNMELGWGFWTKVWSEMSVDHEIHLGDAFSLWNGFDHVPFFSCKSKGRIWNRYGHSYRILVTKFTLQMLYHLGTVLAPYFFISWQSKGIILSSADISEHTWVQNLPLAPCSRGTRRVPQARLRWPIQSMTLDTYHINAYVRIWHHYEYVLKRFS